MKRFAAARVKGNKRCFSLLEMLVAMAIFSIIMLVMTQLVGEVSRSIIAQQEHMESLDEARFSLDRMMLDWSSRVRLPSVTGNYQSQPGNDQFSLVSQVPAFSGTRDLSVVTYRINPTNYVLERGILGYNMNSNDPAPDHNPTLSFPFSPPAVTVSTDFEQLSGAVFRLEICFLKTSSSTTGGFTTSYQNLPSTNLVVAVAALDEKSRTILTPAQMTSLAKALPDVSPDGQDPQSLWIQTINSPNFAANNGIPAATAASIRVYQRILLNNQ